MRCIVTQAPELGGWSVRARGAGSALSASGTGSTPEAAFADALRGVLASSGPKGGAR
ncbi:hypothetical protein [Archangium violaceum]|uniref:hypothetical protein n=1 Tax=Archangium violaceum TaxID=83451 RepID=UPI0037BF5564